MAKANRWKLNNGDGAMKRLRLRGLDPSAIYEITNVDEAALSTVFGAELMQQGLVVENPRETRSSRYLLHGRLPKPKELLADSNSLHLATCVRSEELHLFGRQYNTARFRRPLIRIQFMTPPQRPWEPCV